MTWVVGSGTLDFGILVADIRISYADDSEEMNFGVRKIHQINPSTWAGFAGSISLGFRMINWLQAFVWGDFQRVRMPPNPRSLVQAFVDTAAAQYRQLPESLRAYGCHLLIVGASHDWAELGGRPVFRVAHGFVVKFPLPGETDIDLSETGFNRFAAIGSGAAVHEYRRHLDESVEAGKQGLLAFSPSADQGFANALPMVGYLTSLGLGSVVEVAPQLGISSQMHAVVVTPEGSLLGDNAGADLMLQDGTTRRVPPFPPIANSESDLDRLNRQYSSGHHGVAVG